MPDRCLSPEMIAERLQFAQLHPEFDFLRRESFAKCAGVFICQGDCLRDWRLLIPPPCGQGGAKRRVGVAHGSAQTSRLLRGPPPPPPPPPPPTPAPPPPPPPGGSRRH